MGTKQRLGNQVTEKAGVQLSFCSHFSFSSSSCLFPVLLTFQRTVINKNALRTVESRLLGDTITKEEAIRPRAVVLLS